MNIYSPTSVMIQPETGLRKAPKIGPSKMPRRSYRDSLDPSAGRFRWRAGGAQGAAAPRERRKQGTRLCLRAHRWQRGCAISSRSAIKKIFYVESSYDRSTFFIYLSSTVILMIIDAMSCNHCNHRYTDVSDVSILISVE